MKIGDSVLFNSEYQMSRGFDPTMLLDYYGCGRVIDVLESPPCRLVKIKWEKVDLPWWYETKAVILEGKK
jgi:hypothetical protein